MSIESENTSTSAAEAPANQGPRKAKKAKSAKKVGRAKKAASKPKADRINKKAEVPFPVDLLRNDLVIFAQDANRSAN